MGYDWNKLFLYLVCNRPFMMVIIINKMSVPGSARLRQVLVHCVKSSMKQLVSYEKKCDSLLC